MALSDAAGTLAAEVERLRADLAKAQARCAELEAALQYAHGELAGGKSEYDVGRWMTATDMAARALASDGTKALAAVRLAQRLAKMVTPPKERPADLGLNRREKLALEVEAALTDAFGSGE
jgi:hypothetical protein